MAERGDDDPLGGVIPEDDDAHGRASLLLVESLIHSLVERSILTLRDAVEIVDVAADASIEIALEQGDSHRIKSLALLQSIGASLRHDLPTP